MQTIEDIVTRLSNLGVPDHIVDQHVSRVETWRANHKPKVKRKRLYEFVITASGQYHIFRDKPRKRIGRLPPLNRVKPD